MQRLPDLQVREVITFANESGRISEVQAVGRLHGDDSEDPNTWILIHIPEDIMVRQSSAPMEDPNEACELSGLECYEPSALFAEEWPAGLDAVEIRRGGWRLEATLRGTRHAVTSFYLSNWGDYPSGNDSAADYLARIVPVSRSEEG